MFYGGRIGKNMGKKIDPDATSLGKVLSLYTLLLFSRQRFSLADLSQRMKVSKPTLLRYLLRLEESGFCPVRSEKRGRENFYWLERPEILPKISLDVEGLQQLALCRDFMLHLLPHSIQMKVDAVLQQATAFLPQERANPRPAQERISGKGLLSIGQAFIKGRIDYTPFKDVLESLTQAIRDHTVCTITYKSSRNGPERVFDYAPKRLVAFRESIHISGWLVTDKNPVQRLYESTTDLALYRIINIRPGQRSSAGLPDVLDKQEDCFGYMEDTEDMPFALSVKFAPSAALYVAEREWSTGQEIEDHEDGSITLTLTARNVPEVHSWVLSFGRNAELLSPDWLRQEIAEIVNNLHNIYAGNK